MMKLTKIIKKKERLKEMARKINTNSETLVKKLFTLFHY